MTDPTVTNPPPFNPDLDLITYIEEGQRPRRPRTALNAVLDFMARYILIVCLVAPLVFLAVTVQLEALFPIAALLVVGWAVQRAGDFL